MNAIEMENVSFRFPDSTEALSDISFSIKVGSKTAILGPNGAGKSTLIQHFNGLLRAGQGEVRVLGETLHKKNLPVIRSKVGLVFQNPDDQVFSSTVWEDVCFGPSNQGITGEELEQRCDMALGAVGMREFKHKAPYHLSYGQKKRVAIAGILAMQPDIVVLDEPMAYLDPKAKDELTALLQTMHLLGKTVLVTTHDVDFAAEWADRIILMKQGRILASGGPELLVEPEWIKQAELHLPRVARPFRMVPQLNLERLPRNEQEAARCLWQLVATQTSTKA